MFAAPLQAGQTFARQYTVVSPLSEGGMGAVYVVEHQGTGKQRALKVMHAHVASNPRFVQRFVQEARVGSRVESKHIVDVLDAGVDESTGIPFLVMELLRGETLARRLDRAGTLTPSELLEVFRQLAHGLGRVHAVGVVHRDLKPDNIFLEAGTDGSSCIKILDFGIAKVHENAQTNGGTAALGTPFYMPPEQMTPDANVTPAADVWALGLVAFRCLSGRMFWRAAASLQPSALMVVNEVTNLPMPTASERALELGGAPVPASFDGWFARAVNRDVAARFVNAEEAYLALCTVFGQVGSVTAPIEQQVLTGSVGAANTNAPDYRADAFMPTAGVTPSLGTATNPNPPTAPLMPAKPAGRSGVMRAVSIGAALAAGCLGLFLFFTLKSAEWKEHNSYADKESSAKAKHTPAPNSTTDGTAAADSIGPSTMTSPGRGDLARTNQEIARLKLALQTEQSDGERKKLQLKLQEEQRKAEALQKAPSATSPPQQCNCNRTDPLCDCDDKK